MFCFERSPEVSNFKKSGTMKRGVENIIVSYGTVQYRSFPNNVISSLPLSQRICFAHVVQSLSRSLSRSSERNTSLIIYHVKAKWLSCNFIYLVTIWPFSKNVPKELL